MLYLWALQGKRTGTLHPELPAPLRLSGCCCRPPGACQQEGCLSQPSTGWATAGAVVKTHRRGGSLCASPQATPTSPSSEETPWVSTQPHLASELRGESLDSKGVEEQRHSQTKQETKKQKTPKTTKKRQSKTKTQGKEETSDAEAQAETGFWSLKCLRFNSFSTWKNNNQRAHSLVLEWDFCLFFPWVKGQREKPKGKANHGGLGRRPRALLWSS